MVATSNSFLGKSYLYFNRGKDFFRNQPIRNKNCLWWPCVLTDRDKMANLYRGPSIDASYQVSVHLPRIHYQTWQPQAILVSDWPIFLNLLL
jgi:hypothetical protein